MQRDQLTPSCVFRKRIQILRLKLQSPLQGRPFPCTLHHRFLSITTMEFPMTVRMPPLSGMCFHSDSARGVVRLALSYVVPAWSSMLEAMVLILSRSFFLCVKTVIGGTTGKLFEQNAQVIAQIRNNLAACKVICCQG